MSRIQEIVSNGQRCTEEQRFETIVLIIEEYGLEIMFAIVLRQAFDCPHLGSFKKNLQFAEELPYVSRLELTELMEDIFLDIKIERRGTTQ